MAQFNKKSNEELSKSINKKNDEKSQSSKSRLNSPLNFIERRKDSSSKSPPNPFMSRINISSFLNLVVSDKNEANFSKSKAPCSKLTSSNTKYKKNNGNSSINQTKKNNEEVTLEIESDGSKQFQLQPNIQYQCPVCANELDSSLMFNLTDCSHYACVDCWQSYVINRIENYEIAFGFTCLTCSQELEYNKVVDIIKKTNDPEYTQRLMLRLENFLLERALKQDQNVRRCPNPGCEFAFVLVPDYSGCKQLRKCELRTGCKGQICGRNRCTKFWLDKADHDCKYQPSKIQTKHQSDEDIYYNSSESSSASSSSESSRLSSSSSCLSINNAGAAAANSDARQSKTAQKQNKHHRQHRNINTTGRGIPWWRMCLPFLPRGNTPRRVIRTAENNTHTSKHARRRHVPQFKHHSGIEQGDLLTNTGQSTPSLTSPLSTSSINSEHLDAAATISGATPARSSTNKKKKSRHRKSSQRYKKKPTTNLQQLPSENASLDSFSDIKSCPKCHTYVLKMNDGSCNHMVCVICGCEFCWLCMRQITDMHYLSPSGCTFWGRRQWNVEKRALWQLGTLIGAPVAIGFLAALAIPAMVIGIPLYVGRKIHGALKTKNKDEKRTIAVLGGLGAFIVSPVIAAVTVGLGVPLILAYVYVVMPIALCRASACSCDDPPAQTPEHELDFTQTGPLLTSPTEPTRTEAASDNQDNKHQQNHNDLSNDHDNNNLVTVHQQPFSITNTTTTVTNTNVPAKINTEICIDQHLTTSADESNNFSKDKRTTDLLLLVENKENFNEQLNENLKSNPEQLNEVFSTLPSRFERILIGDRTVSQSAMHIPSYRDINQSMTFSNNGISKSVSQRTNNQNKSAPDNLNV